MILIDNKAGMLFTDGCTAYPLALQSAIFNELACKMPLRALEGTAGAGVIQRLLFTAPCHEVLYFFSNCLLVARL